MTDCPNVAMRELLPELLHDALPAAERVQVERHVAACVACAGEFELLRGARRAMRDVRVPAVDTAAIVAALPRPHGTGRGTIQRHGAPVAPAAPRPAARRSTVLYRIAAALTFVSVGGMSLVISRQYFGASPVAVIDSATARERALRAAPPLASADTPAVTGATGRGLAVHAVLSELDDASLESLISELDQLEAAPLAEPEGTPGSRLVSGSPSGS